MVLQYKKRSFLAKWRDYPGKDKIEGKPDDYDFRLMNENKTKVLAEKGPYKKILKRFRQIEFFKHNR